MSIIQDWNNDEKIVSDLLQVFNSKLDVHMGYILTVVLAIASIFQIIESIHPILFSFVVGELLALEIYFTLRFLMWSKLSEEVMRVEPVDSDEPRIEELRKGSINMYRKYLEKKLLQKV